MESRRSKTGTRNCRKEAKNNQKENDKENEKSINVYSQNNLFWLRSIIENFCEIPIIEIHSTEKILKNFFAGEQWRGLQKVMNRENVKEAHYCSQFGHKKEVYYIP